MTAATRGSGDSLRARQLARSRGQTVHAGGDATGWRAWFGALDIPLKPRAQDRRFEDYTVVLAAAEAGLGVALARTPLAAAYLERSGLVRVSRHEVASPLSYYFVHAKGESRPHVLALIERMQRVLAAAPSK